MATRSSPPHPSPGTRGAAKRRQGGVQISPVTVSLVPAPKYRSLAHRVPVPQANPSEHSCSPSGSQSPAPARERTKRPDPTRPDPAARGQRADSRPPRSARCRPQRSGRCRGAPQKIEARRPHSPSTWSRVPGPKYSVSESRPPSPAQKPAAHPPGPRGRPAHLAPTAGCPRRSTECFGSQPGDPGQKPALPFSDDQTQPRSPPTLSAAPKGDGSCPPFCIPPEGTLRDSNCPPYPAQSAWNQLQSTAARRSHSPGDPGANFAFSESSRGGSSAHSPKARVWGNHLVWAFHPPSPWRSILT